jgi:hypothetical protein
MEHNTPTPRNIFELINLNVVDMSRDFVVMAQKLDTLTYKIDSIVSALYPPTFDAPKTEDADEDEE